MRRRDRGLLSNATSLLVCGLLAGVVVAAAAFPAVAMGGLAAKAGAEAFDSLPAVLTVAQSPQITRVYASDGKTLISTFYDENRRDVPLADVGATMQHAMVAAEDIRFYEHNGVDVKGVLRAFVNNAAGASQQGGSTLTMQYVRQALEYSTTDPQQIVDATEDTPGRKIREMRYAIALEKQLTKDQILERYLNIAPFGNNAFGIYAAAQVYFGKQPKDLTIGESALLAGLVKAPSSFDPLTEDGRVQSMQRRDTYVLPNMVKLKYITEEQMRQALATPLNFKSGHSEPNGCTQIAPANNNWGFFCDYLYRWWLQQPAFGADQYERENRLKSGGYTIVTSLDLVAQRAAYKNIISKKPVGSPDALMLAGIEPGTGRIQLMATNRTFSNDQTNNGTNTNPKKRGAGIKGNYPNTTLPLISGGGDVVGYQFGSTFKIFTLVTALKQGIPLAMRFNAPVQFVSDYIIDPKSPAACQGNHYCPKNAVDSEAGNYNMWTGFGHSVNTFFVPLEQRVGAKNVVATARDMGIQFRAKSDADFAATPDSANQWGAFTLGVSAATPLDVANAYATVAAEGNYCEPLPVISITDFNGNKLDAANPRCKSVMSVDVARAATDAARCPVGDRSAFNACTGGTATATAGVVKRPVLGKTGTTDDDKTAALTVSTRQIAVSGIIADPDNQDISHHYSHNEVNGAVMNTVRDAMAGKPAMNFNAPSALLANGVQKKIPDVTCQTVPAATAALKARGFGVALSATPVASPCPAGTVAKTDPTGSTVQDGVVTLFISTGGGGGGGRG